MRTRYSDKESLHLYAAIVGPMGSKKLRTPTWDERVRKIGHHAAERCITEVGKVLARIKKDSTTRSA